MADVRFIRAEVTDKDATYTLINDCVLGQPAVKAKTTTYLPKPNAADSSAENTARYSAYVTRAVFYNVTKRTLAGLCGLVFARKPETQIPASMENIIADADGSGVSLEQVAKKAFKRVVSLGRSGFLTDFPDVDGEVSKADIDAGVARPTITGYRPQDIINWHVGAKGALQVLELVVLKEKIDDVQDDPFATELVEQIRVLRMVGGQYVVELYKESAEGQFEIPYVSYVPKDASGKPLDHIPFTFVGAENNDAEVDEAPLLDISTLNIAHYRNSADYEESTYQVGQPTPYFTGLTKDWVDDVLKGAVHLGSRAAIPLPVGATAGLLQAAPNSMPKEAMDQKEQQMVALGAKLIDPKTVEKTATEASFDNTSETSVLAASAVNVSEAVEFSLKEAALFAGENPDDIKYELSTDFKTAAMTADERRQMLDEWVAGAITFSELRENLRKTGVATLDEEEAKTLVDAEAKERADRVTKAALDVQPKPEQNNNNNDNDNQ